MNFEWDSEKNRELMQERGISFEEIVLLLGSGILWKVAVHWNQENYPNQSVFLIPINGYIQVVPFVRDGETFFLKTIFPSRKLTRIYKAEMEANE